MALRAQLSNFVLTAALVLAATMWMAARPDSVRAEADSQLYARVIVDSTALRSGPSGSFRRVHIAHRGEVFRVLGRATRGYWFRVQMQDGTEAWVLGDAVFNHEIGEDEAQAGELWPGVMVAPALATAHGEIAILAGVLSDGGMLAVRPSWLLAPTFGIELNAQAAVAPGGRLWIATVGPYINVLPRSPIIPFLTVQGGLAASSPNADTFLLEQGNVTALAAGAGLRIAFRYRVTLRAEARAWAFYEANRFVAQEEIAGGLTVFF